MEFLQHFLLGKPLERNGQESAGLMSTLVWDEQPGPDRSSPGLDVETADSFLLRGPGRPDHRRQPPPANAIRPGGHGTTTTRCAPTSPRCTRTASGASASAGAPPPALRAETVSYDYDNRMLDGNTDENGVPCGPTGCLYSRPADRTDAFVNVAPKLSLAVDLRDGLVAYTTASVGFRPPEITELYRLQRSQRTADLDSERLDALEIGLQGCAGRRSTWRSRSSTCARTT